MIRKIFKRVDRSFKKYSKVKVDIDKLKVVNGNVYPIEQKELSGLRNVK